MSKLKRLLGALSLVALFIFSSCVDDEIAPEVTALRQAQVDLLNAQVATEQAFTVWQAADAAYRQAQADNQVLLNAGVTLANELTASSNAVTMLNNLEAMEASALSHQEDLARKQILLEDAQADLAQYLAEAGLQEAAEYLNAWTSLQTGDDVDLPGIAPDFTPAGGGIIALTKSIANAQADLALMQLLYSGGVHGGTLQSVLIARAEENVTFAEADLAAFLASITAGEAVVAGTDDPSAALEASLLALAADTIAQRVRIDSIEAILDGIDGLSATEDSIASAFENVDSALGMNQDLPSDDDIKVDGVHMDNFVTGGDVYVTETANVKAANASIATALADSALFVTYADSLTAIVAAYQESTFDDIDAIIDPLFDAYVEDSLAAADTGSDARENANELAYAEYLAELGAFEAKSNAFLGKLPSGQADAGSFFGTDGLDSDNDNGLVDFNATDDAGVLLDGAFGFKVFVVEDVALKPTPQDTADLVAARNDWDGQGKADLFDDYDGDRYGAAGGGTLFTAAIVGAGNKLNGGADNGGIDSGDSTNPYGAFKNGGSDSDDLNLSRAIYQNAVKAYEDVLDEVDAIEAYAAELKAGKKTTTATSYTTTIAAVTDALSNPNTPVINDFLLAINGAADILDLAFTEDGEGLTEDGTSGNPLYDNIKDIVDKLDASGTGFRAVLATAQAKLDFATFQVTDYLTAYNAALVVLGDVSGTQDSMRIAPEFALFGAKETMNQLSALVADAKENLDNVANLELVVGTGNIPEESEIVIYRFNNVNYTITELDDLADALADAQVSTTGGGTGAVDTKEDAVSTAQFNVSQENHDLADLEANIAEKEADIAVYETELSVLQALADEIQALLTAALAG